MSRHTLTAEQSAVREEFTHAYGLEPEQIFFDGDKPKPYFAFAALAILATELGDFTDISPVPVVVTATLPDAVTLAYQVTSARGFTRTGYGSCIIGARLPEGVVEDAAQAEAIAKGRALRNALVLAGFDPLHAHRHPTRRETPRAEDTARNKDLSAIHSLRDQLGWDENKYRDMLDTFFDVRSAADLTPPRRRECVQQLSDLKALGETERAARITFARGAKWERQRQ